MKTPLARIRRSALQLAAALLLAPLALAAATVTEAPWGKDQAGDAVALYTITSPHGELKISTYGARIVSIRVPDAQGKMGNVIVGFDAVDGYLTGRGSAMGATIGRYANRIAGGQFKLNDVTFNIPKNNGNNALHGGTVGFDKKVWTGKIVKDGVEMTFTSPDGDMGFPGNLTVHVTFTLHETRGNPAVSIEYAATTDKPTVLNLTNHAYFNLGEDPATPVLDDQAMFRADSYTPTDNSGIPTGEIAPVEGTPLDFRQTHAIKDHVPQRGYDNNFVLRGMGAKQAAAEVRDPHSGRTIQVFTDQPGVQFYVPLFPAPPPAASGPPAAGDTARRPAPLAAFCLETQHFPDSPNHANFPITVLRPGQKFKSKTTYVFGVSHTAAK